MLNMAKVLVIRFASRSKIKTKELNQLVLDTRNWGAALKFSKKCSKSMILTHAKLL